MKADRKWVEADLSPCVRHYMSAAALCLFMRSPHRFQLHGPQSRPLIPSRFPVKVRQFVPSSRAFTPARFRQQLQRKELAHGCGPSPSLKHTHIYLKAASVFVDLRANRTVLLLIKLQCRSQHETQRVSCKGLNWKQRCPRDRRLSHSSLLIR